MNEKKKNSTQKGEFIDLEESQYKKRTNFKTISFLIILLSLLTLLAIFFLEKFNYINQFLFSPKIVNNNKTTEIQPGVINTKNWVEKRQVENLNKRINEINEEILENKLKISKSDSLILDLKQKIKILENQQKGNSNFYYAEKYLILNDLLNVKNKFDNRENFNLELDKLISRFNDQPEIKTLIIFFQDIRVDEIISEGDLLDILNMKINFYQRDLSDFIDSNLTSDISAKEDIFESKENFYSYLKKLFKSTYKITKIETTENQNSQGMISEIKLVESLKLAKEYLMIGDLNKSIQILSKSNFDENTIDQWIEDAKTLHKTKQKLKLLEKKLLDIIGREVD